MYIAHKESPAWPKTHIYHIVSLSQIQGYILVYFIYIYIYICIYIYVNNNININIDININVNIEIKINIDINIKIINIDININNKVICIYLYIYIYIWSHPPEPTFSIVYFLYLYICTCVCFCKSQYVLWNMLYSCIPKLRIAAEARFTLKSSRCGCRQVLQQQLSSWRLGPIWAAGQLNQWLWMVKQCHRNHP